MLRRVLALVAGVLLFQQLPALPSAAWLWALPLLLPGWLLLRRRPLAPLLATGFAYAFLHALLTAPAFLPPGFLGKTLVAEGRVEGLPRRQGRRLKFFFRADRLQLGGRQVAGEWRFRLNWYGDVPELHGGERWRLSLRLKPVAGFRNPGSFDYVGWLYARGVRYSGYVKGGGERLAGAGASLEAVREALSRRLEAVVDPPRAAGVLRALAVGDRAGLSRHDRDLFAATGTSHLMAISGLHIGLVAGLVFLLARFFWSRIPRLCARWPAMVAATVPAMAAATAYAALAGFSLPTRRALVMLLVVLGALWWRRHLHPLQGMALALLLVVALDPLSLQSAGFWLSFGAVAILYLSAGWWPGRGAWLGQQFAISFGLMPILAWQQMELSLVSPLVNLAAIPLFSLLVVPGVLLGLLLDLLPGGAGGLLLQATAWLVEQLLPALEWAARWNPRLPGSGPWPWLLAGGVLLAGAGLKGRRMLVAALLLAVPAVLVGGSAGQRPSPNTFELTLLDVGQGLAAVVRTARHLLVYDLGPRFPSGFDTGSAVVAPFLRRQGEKRVNLLVLSHGDTDHVGGARGLLRQVEVEALLGGEPDRLSLGRPVAPCRRGRQWWWDGVHFEILSPGEGAAGGNDASCVLRVATGGQVLLLTGDIEAARERELVLRQGSRLHSSVVVAAHHGSGGSSSAVFVAATAPRLVLFSAGVGNRWGFPRQEVLQRWCEQGARPLNTAAEGAIRLHFGPGGVTTSASHARSHRRYWQWQMEQQLPVACSMIAGLQDGG